jgi:hypothetical protein
LTTQFIDNSVYWQLSLLTTQFIDNSVYWQLSLLTTQFIENSVYWQLSLLTTQFIDNSVYWQLSLLTTQFIATYFRSYLFFYNNLKNIDFNGSLGIHNITTKNYYEYGKLRKKLIIADMECIFVSITIPIYFILRFESIIRL